MRVAKGLRVAPSQVELSLGRGGNRKLPLKVGNHGTQPLHARLTVHNLDGTDADWILLQPNDFTLASARGRNVLVMARPGSEVKEHRYGFLRVSVDSDGDASQTRDLPLALLAATSTKPSIDTGSVVWQADGDRPAFVLPVTNRGTVHLPLNGRLTISNGLGQKMEVTGGFNRWLLPGQEGEIRFSMQHALAASTYAVKIEIQTGEGFEPLTISQQVKVD